MQLLQRKSQLIVLRFVIGEVVEVLLGHCTYAALTCRQLLCVFCRSYTFVRYAGREARPIWPEVREEFRHFRALLGLCRSDWIRQWNPYVMASDASETGFGISASWWPRHVVSAVGRTSERSRFKRLPGCSARAHALEAAGFEPAADEKDPDSAAKRSALGGDDAAFAAATSAGTTAAAVGRQGRGCWWRPRGCFAS